MTRNFPVLVIVASLFELQFISVSYCLGAFQQSECGCRNDTLSRRHIFGGIQATRSQWPWVVQLTLNGSHHCGGSLIDERIIITAAHCFAGNLPLSWYRVSVRAPGQNQAEYLEIESAKFHPLFNPTAYRVSQMGYDIAVLKLKHKPQIVNPICLPNAHTTKPSNTSVCFVAGWGKRGGRGVRTSGLRYVAVPVLERSVCSGEWTGLDETMICAGNYHHHNRALRKGSCDGDSGGPLMCEVGTQWVLFGAVNFGSWDFCLRRPGVFADIKNLIHWIKSSTQQLKVCNVVANTNFLAAQLPDSSLLIAGYMEERWEDCCARCEANGECLSWTWHDPKKWHGGGQCRLFNRLPGPGESYTETICTSGYKITSSLKDCSGIKSVNPDARSGEYKLMINGALKSVYCDMDTQGGGWTVFQRRIDGSVDFKRDWSAYKEGFGDVSGEHWLGNEALHYLTSSGDYDLLIEVREWNRSCSLYSFYSNFSIANEDQEYRLSKVHIMEGTFGDHPRWGLSFHIGMSFVTPDMNRKGNCEQGGWWYSGCFGRVNLNGLYSKSPCVNGAGYFVFWNAHGRRYSFQGSEVKIRRRESRASGRHRGWCRERSCAIQCKRDEYCGCGSWTDCISKLVL